MATRLGACAQARSLSAARGRLVGGGKNRPDCPNHSLAANPPSSVSFWSRVIAGAGVVVPSARFHGKPSFPPEQRWSFAAVRGLPLSSSKRDLRAALHAGRFPIPIEMMQFYASPRPKREVMQGRVDHTANNALTAAAAAGAPLVAEDGVSGGTSRRRDPKDRASEGNLHLGVGLTRRWGAEFRPGDIPKVFRPPTAAGFERQYRDVCATGQAAVLPVPTGSWSFKFGADHEAKLFVQQWDELAREGGLPRFFTASRDFSSRGTSSGKTGADDTLDSIGPDAIVVHGSFAHRQAVEILGLNCASRAGHSVFATGWPMLRDFTVMQRIMAPFVENRVKRFVHIVPADLSPVTPDTLVAICELSNESEARRAVRVLDGSLFRNRRLSLRVLE